MRHSQRNSETVTIQQKSTVISHLIRKKFICIFIDTQKVRWFYASPMRIMLRNLLLSIGFFNDFLAILIFKFDWSHWNDLIQQRSIV